MLTEAGRRWINRLCNGLAPYRTPGAAANNCPICWYLPWIPQLVGAVAASDKLTVKPWT